MCILTITAICQSWMYNLVHENKANSEMLDKDTFNDVNFSPTHETTNFNMTLL